MTPLFPVFIATLFPELYPGPLGVSLCGKALARGAWSLTALGISTKAMSTRLDDAPYGGGGGMVLCAEAGARALDEAFAAAPKGAVGICPTPRGLPLDQARVRALAQSPGLVFLCARYEAYDQRLAEEYDLQELCIGDFLLASGDSAAIAILEAVVRLLPGTLAERDSLKHESFESGLLEYPHYTRPALWRGRAVPEVLLSGDRARIAEWRSEQARALTRGRRPDLWRRYSARAKRRSE